MECRPSTVGGARRLKWKALAELWGQGVWARSVNVWARLKVQLCGRLGAAGWAFGTNLCCHVCIK